MTDEDSDSFQREAIIDNQLLHTEYQEANQEFRHRNQLLYNTFYLLIIATGAFLGLFIRFGSTNSGILLGSLIIASGIVGTIIGHLFLKHFHERASAEAIRMHTEWIANGKREKSKKALSLEWSVAGGSAKYDEAQDCIVRRGSHVHYITQWPHQLLSAECFGLALIYLGAGAVVGGIILVSSSVTSGVLSVFLGGISSMLIILFYWVAMKQSRAPENEPLY